MSVGENVFDQMMRNRFEGKRGPGHKSREALTSLTAPIKREQIKIHFRTELTYLNLFLFATDAKEK
jgi:hypothetical protein